MDNLKYFFLFRPFIFRTPDSKQKKNQNKIIYCPSIECYYLLLYEVNYRIITNLIQSRQIAIFK